MEEVILATVGVGFVVASSAAERYHGRRMQQNIEAMKQAYLHRGEEEAAREYRKLEGDWRVALSVWAMTWLMPIGMLLIITALFLVAF